MINYKILAPNEWGQNQNQNINVVRAGTWRINFFDPEFPNKFKEVYIYRIYLKFVAKIDCKNIKVVRDCLKKWADQYLNNRKFEDIKNGLEVKLN